MKRKIKRQRQPMGEGKEETEKSVCCVCLLFRKC